MNVMTTTSERFATPRQNTAARYFGRAAWAECQRLAVVYGFTLDWEDDGEWRTLLLLGRDSPAEMTLRLPKMAFDNRRLFDTTGSILRWMMRMGQYWTGRDIDFFALPR